MIKDIFQLPDEAAREEWIASEVISDQQRWGGFTDPGLAQSYLQLLFHYLMNERPDAEHNTACVCKLVGASYVSQGYRTPFWSIVHDAAERHPDDPMYQKARGLEYRMGNAEVDEVALFLEREISEQPVEEERERDLGALAVARVCYQKSRVKHIRMQRRGDAPKQEEPAVLTACREFLQEQTPARIKAYLDRYVIGQDEAKEVLATAVYNHFLRIVYPAEGLVKRNVLMVGPSGCGKTELLRRLQDLLPVPVVMMDFSGVVATPWRGRNKEEALQALCHKAGGDQALAERGIVFLDEFDKIIPTHPDSRGGDINDELQGQLLGMLEGTVLDVPAEDGRSTALRMDTSHILFICAGAFEGLEGIVRKDYVPGGIGYGKVLEKGTDFVVTGERLRPAHLIEYGMKPELAGRLGSVTVLQRLDEGMMRRILTDAEDNVLRRFESEMRLEDDIGLRFTDEAIDVVVERTMQMRIGARGLNAVVREMLSDLLYDLPMMEDVREVVLTGVAARGEEKPVYVYR